VGERPYFRLWLLEWALQEAGKSPVTEQFYLSGVTFFTLGYGDIVPHTESARTVSVIEAGCGIGFIAVVIGYLPVLYQLFSRREAHVIQLDARAGSPPTATTMLSRHAEADSLDKLDDLLREWEVWGSDLLESHLSYPMLVYYRSQHDNQSWLAALSAVMDCCALILVGVEEMKPLQARMTFPWRARWSWKWHDRFRSNHHGMTAATAFPGGLSADGRISRKPVYNGKVVRKPRRSWPHCAQPMSRCWMALRRRCC
jgi:hypothetical protein